MTKDFSLAPSLAASALVHLAALVAASALIGQRNHFPEKNLISIALLDPIQDNKTIRPRTEDATKTEPPKQPPAQRKREPVRAEPPPHPTVKSEITKADETKTPPPTTLNSTRESATHEGGGSATGVGNRAG